MNPIFARIFRPNTLRILLPCALLTAGTVCTAAFSAAPNVPETAPAAAEVAVPSVLTQFTDDLGVPSALTFTEKLMDTESIGQGNLVLVSSQWRWGFPKQSLVNLYEAGNGSYLLSGSNITVDAAVPDALNEMLADFRQKTGCTTLMVSEGCRSEAEQTAIYQQAVHAYGKRAEEIAAPAGASEYHTGLAVALHHFRKEIVEDFTGQGQDSWIADHCARYGFVIRYPEGKEDITGHSAQPWHLRYVGKPHAYLMERKGYCLEEYLDYLKHYPAEGNHVQVTDNENRRYEIYYVAAAEKKTAVPVPETEAYSISGDNRSGWIVTVALKETP